MNRFSPRRPSMRKLLCVMAVLGVTAIAATPAQAARHSINSTVVVAELETTGTPPVSGTVDYAGTITTSRPFGSGAIVGQNVFGPVPDFQGTFHVFYNKGSAKGSVDGSGTINADGSISFAGTGEITKGTGKYKGAHGNFTMNGSQPANSTVSSFEIDGSIKY